MTILTRLLARIEPPRPPEPPRDPLDGYRDRAAIRGLPDPTIFTATHRPVVARAEREAA